MPRVVEGRAPDLTATLPGGSPPPPTSRSTSATRTSPGSADPTKTPTAYYASTCPKAPTCRCAPPPTSPAASTTGPAKHSDSWHYQNDSPSSLRTPV